MEQSHVSNLFAVRTLQRSLPPPRHKPPSQSVRHLGLDRPFSPFLYSIPRPLPDVKTGRVNQGNHHQLGRPGWLDFPLTLRLHTHLYSISSLSDKVVQKSARCGGR